MGAFILAGLVAVGTLAIAGIVLLADMMSDAPGTSISPGPVLVVGFGISGVIFASHWLPHIGW